MRDKLPYREYRKAYTKGPCDSRYDKHYVPHNMFSWGCGVDAKLLCYAKREQIEHHRVAARFAHDDRHRERGSVPTRILPRWVYGGE